MGEKSGGRLIVEIPADAETEAGGVDGVVGSPECEAVAGIGVGVVDVAAHTLYGEVGIDVALAGCPILARQKRRVKA